jgi:hypothetical protein
MYMYGMKDILLYLNANSKFLEVYNYSVHSPKIVECNTIVDSNGKFTRRSKNWRFQNGFFVVEYSKGSYILTAPVCSGHTADRFPAEHSNTYFHGLQPILRTYNISRNMTFDQTSLQRTPESVTPSSDVVKSFNSISSTPRQSLSHSSCVF